jgi:hypothetical protein
MSDASIESALEPVKLLQRICERGRDDGGRLAVQTLCLAQPGATGRVPQGPSEVPGGLGVVVGTLSTGNVAPRDRQPSEPSVVHDHVRLRHHQIDPVACIAARIGARNVEHAGTTEGGEAVGSAASGGQLSTAGRSAEMISDGRSDADREMLVKRVGEHLLPAAESGRLRRPGPAVAAPCAGDRHADLLGHLIPGQALVTQLQDLLCGGWMSGSAAATNGDPGATKFMAHGGPGNAQLSTDLAQGQPLSVQVLAGMVRMLSEDVQAMAPHNTHAIGMLAPDTLTRRRERIAGIQALSIDTIELYERNMIDELALRLAHGELPVGS